MTGNAASPDTLNEREQAILQRLAAGLSDQQIADDLFLSLHTVKWYNRQIYSKLGVSSRTQAIAHAKDMGALGDVSTRLPTSVARLPAQTTLFIGRQREMAEVKRLLDTSRLLTLTGAGGTGKTRLALHVAAAVADAFADGVYFVDLAPLSDHTLVPKAIAGVLGVLEQPAEPLVETLKRVLAQRALLLLIDNYEHLITAAPVVTTLLAAVPRLKVLAISRESLRLAGEQEYVVPPLSLPGAGAVSGGRSLGAIEGICSEGLSIDVLDGLASLVDKNLVQQKEAPDGELRFILLEMIHEYARERLNASGEEEMKLRWHAEYFVALAERAEPEFRLAGYEYWVQRLELDLGNLRAALEWLLSGGDLALGARLAGALCLFWYGNGYHVEGRRWTQQLLEHLDDMPLIYQPKFLLSAGHMAYMENLDAGKPLFTRARDIAREVGDRHQMAWALALLGYTMLPEPQAATPIVEESLALFRELEHQPGIAQALNILGEIARYSGDDGRARQAYEECLAVAQQTGERRRICFIYNNLAFLALHAGEAEQAKDLARQELQVARTMNNRLLSAIALATLAGAIGALGQPERAARLLGASESALERLGAFHQPNDKREIDEMIASVRAQLDETTFQAIWTEGRDLPQEQAIQQALAERNAPLPEGG